jgi:tetratricopeptide (TPR) repeat protein
MENYYSLLGVSSQAGEQDIKRAFREKAKKIHPDIAGQGTEREMRRLLAAYQTLSNGERRQAYDRAYRRFTEKYRFDYRTFLRERRDDPESQAKLIFFELLHLEEDAALEIWQNQGGLDFPLERYLDREDWMDCAFLLAEELEKRQRYHEAFVLLIALVREERRKPYFRHFMEEVEAALKDLVRYRLKAGVDLEEYIHCLETLLSLGFPPKDEARWMRSLAEALSVQGDLGEARRVLREALRRNPALSGAGRLRQKLGVKG